MRYKEFNSNKVLETCINLFWKSSFGAVSIKEIVTETNVNRFSLYEEFENKEGILIASIDLYKERYSSSKFELLYKEASLNEVLFNFYMSFMKDEESHPSGCFVIQMATELADNNLDIKSNLDLYLKELEQHFLAILLKYYETKDSAEYLSKHLTGLFCSLTTSCVIRSYNERKSLVNNGISMLLKNQSSYATNA